MVAILRRYLARRNHRHARMADELGPQLGPQPLLARLSVSADVGAQMDGFRAGLLDQPRRLRDDVAAPDDEWQALPQIRERLEQEADAIGPNLIQRRGARHEDRVVEDEERDHRLRHRGCRGQRRMVVHPQVAREQDDRPRQRLGYDSASWSAAAHFSPSASIAARSASPNA